MRLFFLKHLSFVSDTSSRFSACVIAQLLLRVVLVFCPTVVYAAEVRVAVASNFSDTMKALVAEFEEAQPYRVKVSYGSSGKLYAQIKHGAPYELFFSADQTLPKALVRDGFAVINNVYTYAIGTLVLWSADPNLLERNASRLHSGEYLHLALANPRFAPYGRAAQEVLEALDLTPDSRSKWVTGENVAQTYQYIHSGNAEMGFISLSQLRAPILSGKWDAINGSYWQVPDTLYQPIKQDLVLLKRGHNSAAARALYHFVRSERGLEMIKQYGYQVESTVDKFD